MGNAKNIERMSIADENISTPLKISPVKINNPLRKRTPAQNKVR